MMSYQYKFQDDDQTKVKGSVKYEKPSVTTKITAKERFFPSIVSIESTIGCFVLALQVRILWDCSGVWCRDKDQPTQRSGGDCQRRSATGCLSEDQVSCVSALSGISSFPPSFGILGIERMIYKYYCFVLGKHISILFLIHKC